MNDLVSVVVPVYNTEKHLEECIKSLLTQSYKNIEIIIVNDASTDKSDIIIRSLEKKYKNIKYIKLLKNEGQGQARNKGIIESKGEWLMFLDSDDTYDYKMVEKMMHKKSELTISNFYRKENNKIKENIVNINEGLYSRNEFLKKIYAEYPINWLSCIGTKLYKMDIIKKNNIKFQKKDKYNEDLGFVVEYLKYINEVVVIKFQGYCYLKRKGSTQHAYRENALQTIGNPRKKLRELLEESKIFDEQKRKEYAKDMLEIYFSILLNDSRTKDEFEKNISSILLSKEYLNYIKPYNNTSGIRLRIMEQLLKSKKIDILYLWIIIFIFLRKVKEKLI